MRPDQTPLLDRTANVLAEGYPFALRRRRRSGNAFVTRLMGRRAIGIGGPDATRLFYDEARFERRGALPTPVINTLFGQGAVHTLDGEAHRARKAMFIALAGPPGLASLKAEADDEWARAAERWSRRPEVVLFDEARAVLAASVCRWTSLPLPQADVPSFAADMTAMVDGFGSVGLRHFEARRARRRAEVRVGTLIDRVREGTTSVPAESATAVIARHHGTDGRLLDSHTAAVELLNVIRP